MSDAVYILVNDDGMMVRAYESKQEAVNVIDTV